MNLKCCNLIQILICMCITCIPNKALVHVAVHSPVHSFRTRESHLHNVTRATASIIDIFALSFWDIYKKCWHIRWAFLAVFFFPFSVSKLLITGNSRLGQCVDFINSGFGTQLKLTDAMMCLSLTVTCLFQEPPTKTSAHPQLCQQSNYVSIYWGEERHSLASFLCVVASKWYILQIFVTIRKG